MNSSTEPMKPIEASSTTEKSSNTQFSLNMESSTGNKLNLVKESSANDSPNLVLQEIRSLKYLIILVCCGYLVVKCRLVQRIRRRMARNSMENVVAFQHDQEDF